MVAMGGRGADLVFEAVEDVNTLIDFRYQQHFKGPRGGNGSGRDRSGADAKTVVVKVPVGTEILDEDQENPAGRHERARPAPDIAARRRWRLR